MPVERVTELRDSPVSPSPRVTVLMAVFNGRRYLREAIDSILGQTFSDFEFLIIDDGSSDDTRDIILSYTDPRIRLVANTANMGLTKSLNRGLALARGPLVARQDADDVSHVTRLEKQVEFLGRHPEVVLLGAQARTINGRGRAARGVPWPKALTEIGIRWQLMFDSPFVHTSVIFRRDVVWGKLGGYDERFITSQDYELWSRIASRYPVRNLADYLVDSRVHAESTSLRYARENIEKVREPLRENLHRYLQPAESPERWLDLWIAANNVRVYGRDIQLDELTMFIDRFHARFLQLHAAGTPQPEIRRHIAATIARIALNIAPSNTLMSFRLLARAFGTDPAVTRSAIIGRIAAVVGGRQTRHSV